MALNWSKQNARTRMRDRGTERANLVIPFAAPLGWKGPPSRRAPPPRKADLRAEATAAAAMQPVRKVATRVTVRCLPCDRTKIVSVLLRPGLRFRCSRCGSPAAIVGSGS
jgi:ribosomal protein S14